MTKLKPSLGKANFEAVFEVPDGPPIPLSFHQGISKEVSIWRAGLVAGASYFPGALSRDSTVFILEGTGTLLLGDRRVEYGPDTVVQVPEGLDHCFAYITTATHYLRVYRRS